jgi:arylsulfatase A-like enzyme
VPRKFLFIAAVLGALWQVAPMAEADEARPNVVYLVADELGYYEPAFMGNPNIQTPNLDKLAAEGIVLRNMFAGSSVCAPTRCCLLTGKHSGHTSVRSNGGGTPLRSDEETIASVLKRRGYATGGFGKWGCGGRDSTGVPEKHGFDVFLGYYDQVHAHTYYPPYLIRNSEEVPLAGNRGGSDGPIYSHYVIHDAALKFIREHSQQPFFAYLPYTPPHGNFDIPDSDPAWAMYQDKPWPEAARRYAAMVTLVDRQVGQLLALLKELRIDDNTVVFFSGDNGANDYFKSAEYPRGVHGGNKHPTTGVEFRGTKGTLYEGGLRVPFVARWPGKIAPGRVSEHLGYFPDMLPTMAEIAGATPPADIDGLSILPELIGEGAAGHPQAQHDFLYWEIGGWTAIRQSQWRAVRPKANQPWELYDLSTDPSESKDLAAEHPQILAKLTELAERAHQPVREGTFSTTKRHERDRRAKFGRHDEEEPAPPRKGKKKKKS